MQLDLTKREKWILGILLFFAIVAHFINLGLMPLMGDEGLRALVAFEMMQTENYIVPTNWGDFYYRKPPLYNWILIGFFKLFDSYSMLVMRLPSVIPLFILSGATWFVSRKHIGEKAGILAAFAFLLSGRLLTRDSMLGHIDVLYSLVTFIGFYAVFFFQKRKSYWLLFLVSYLLAAMGVLMKGLPSFLFQGFTIVLWLVYQKEWKRLFSLAHFTGILLFLSIVVGYFYTYSQYNSLEVYFDELYGQAAMRTVVDKPWYEGVLNIFTFPIENIGHLFPSSLLLLFAIRRGIFRRWMQSDFSAFTLLVLAVNVVPYWLSPGYYPRYLFMLYPLVMILLADAYFSFDKERNWRHKTWEGIFLFLGVVVTIAPAAAYVVPEVRSLPNAMVYASILIPLGAGVIYLWMRFKEQRLWWSFAFVVLFRLGFDVLVLPYRYYVEDNLENHKKEMAQNILDAADGKRVVIYRKSPLYFDYAYYIGIGQNEIVQKVNNTDQPYLYLLDDHRLSAFEDYEVLYRCKVRYKEYWINLVEFTEKEASDAPTE
jgi:4-amino-4-deoxy-L-arabinose transferase-like glycosyltransferase